MGPTRMVLSKPVIAAVSGYAVAGGLELALWCDLRVAEEDAVFGVFCRRWGVPLIDGGTVRLPRLIGHSRAMDMILTGRAVRRRRSAGDGVGQSGGAQGPGPAGGRGAGGRAGRAAAAVHAIGSAVGAAPVGDYRNPRRSTSNSPASPASPPRPWKVPDGSPRAPAATARPRELAAGQRSALVDGVARAEVVDLRVTVFVGDGVVEPSTVRCVLILSKVILLSVPPMLTVSHVPVTVSVLFEPPTFSDLPLAQSRVAVVPSDP